MGSKLTLLACTLLAGVSAAAATSDHSRLMRADQVGCAYFNDNPDSMLVAVAMFQWTVSEAPVMHVFDMHRVKDGTQRALRYCAERSFAKIEDVARDVFGRL